jgi:hypothetical protein
MKKEIFNKESVYIVKQPEHSIMTVIVVKDDYPKSDKFRDLIDSIIDISDVFFIFVSNKSTINPKKFTTLYRSNGFIMKSNEKTMAEELFYLLGYSREIFNRHVSYLMINDWNIEDIKIEPLHDNIVTWTTSTLSSPVLDIMRCSSENIWGIYKARAEKTIWGKETIISVPGNDYLTHTSESPFIYIKNTVIDKFLEKNNIESYLGTFIGDNLGDAIASLIIDLGITFLREANFKQE